MQTLVTLCVLLVAITLAACAVKAAEPPPSRTVLDHNNELMRYADSTYNVVCYRVEHHEGIWCLERSSRRAP